MKTHKEQSRIQVIDWLLRMMKGMMIGSGAILPGVSGGALAAVFGLYEPLIVFLSDITNDFVKRVMYFLPVGVGGILGVFVLAYPLDYGLQYYPVHVLWAFIGAIYRNASFALPGSGQAWTHAWAYHTSVNGCHCHVFHSVLVQ